MKYLANIISSSRVIGAIILFLFKDITPSFLIIYVLCAFTDLIDGPIARKTGSTSPLGATLDTVGDVMTYLALTKILITKKLVPTWILVWIISAGVLFGICSFVSLKRFGKFYLPHTWLGKIFGGSVFVLPIMMQFMPGEVWMAVICTVATIHSFELLYVQLKSDEALSFVPTALKINAKET